MPFDGIRRVLRVHFGTRGVRRAIDDEIAFHVDTRVDVLRGRGLREDEAREIALREFGDVTAARQELAAIDTRTSQRASRHEWWADLARDIVLGARSMRRQPVLTAVILMTLALGIGANGAIFTVVQAALLAPLPYQRADRLVHLWETRTSDSERSESSFPNFLDVRAGSRSLARIEGYDPTNVTVGGADGPARIQGGRVTAGFFSMLGVVPALGRAFVTGEDAPGAPRIVILSDGFWRQRFSGERDVLGRTLTIDNAAYAIVGVLPARFHFAPIGVADVWVPLDRDAGTRAERFNHWLNVVGRLRDDATVDDARRDIATVMSRLAAEYPQTNSGRSATLVPLREQIVGDVRPLLLVLSGAATLVLLVACANVAGLLLARSIARTRELAIRTALGASRGRLVRQLLTESVVIALVGGTLAVVVAGVGASVLVAAIPDGTRSGMPYWSDVGVSARTLVYTMAVAVIAGVAFGLVPALTASRASLGELLRRGGRGVVGGSARFRDALIAGEIALTIVLLVGTGLLVRSLRELLRVDAGFDAGQVMTARIALAGPRYATEDAQRRFFDDVLARVREVPGVRAAGAVSNLPLNGGGTNTFFVTGKPEPSAAQRPEATMRAVAGEYFEALRIRVLEGRQFSRRDDTTTAPVIMINTSLARRLFANGEAVGSRFRFYAFPERDWEVIGVVADVKTSRLDADAPPTVYYAQSQAPQNRMSLAIRVGCPRPPGGGASDGACKVSGLTGAIRRAVATSDPNVPVYAVGSMEQQVLDSPAVFARRYPLLLVGLFAATALVLAVVGLYGVISFAVGQRTREFGVRMALGASPSVIRIAVLRRGAVVAGTGVALGIPGALALTRTMRGMLFGVGTTDLATYAGACGVLVTVALLASWVPARRATRIQPTIALTADS